MDQKCSQCCKVCRAIRVQVAPASEDKEDQRADEDEEDVQVDSGTHEDCSDSWWTDTSWTEVQTDEAKLEEDVVNAHGTEDAPFEPQHAAPPFYAEEGDARGG